MKKILLLFILIPFLNFSQVQIGQDIDGETSSNTFGNAIQLSSDGNIVAIAAMSNYENGNNSGHIRIYENISGVWTQIGQDIDGDTAGDFFGRSISLSSDGNIVAASASQNDINSTGFGYVRIYENLEGIWTQIGQDIEGTSIDDYFGASVKLSSDGSILAVSAPNDSTNGFRAGQVKVYENQLGNWVQIGQSINGEFIEDNLGWSLSLSSDGSILAISSIYNDNNGTNSGYVRVFEYQNGTWVQVGNNIVGETANDTFGNSISLSSDGSILAIGATGNDDNGTNSGHARIYENQNENWIQIGNDIDGEEEYDQFGNSISLSSDGSIVVIGSRFNDGNGINSGQVRIYENQSYTWTQIGQDLYGEASGDNFGSAVSLSLDASVVAVSGPNNDGNGGGSGHVRVYDLSAILSVESFQNDFFNVFVNENTENIEIKLYENQILNRVNLYTIDGKYLYSEKSLELNTNSLSRGIYVIEVETNNGKSAKKIIIK